MQYKYANTKHSTGTVYWQVLILDKCAPQGQMCRMKHKMCPWVSPVPEVVGVTQLKCIVSEFVGIKATYARTSKIKLHCSCLFSFKNVLTVVNPFA